MKIAQVVSTFPPYKGGMGNVAFHYSLELSKRGHVVDVCTPRHRRQQAELHTFRVRGLSAWWQVGNGSLMPQLLWKLRGYDVVHLHYPFFGSDVFVALARRLGLIRRLVVTYHMDIVGRGLLGWYCRWHNRYLLPWVIASADRVIVTSRDYATAGILAPLVRRRPEAFIDIPLGANVAIFHPQPPDEPLISTLALPPGQPVLLFVAALDAAHYFKGLHLLLPALRRLRHPATLLVVGRGPLRAQYETQARALGVADHVRFVGYVSDFDLARYYNLADVFVLPSVDTSEAFGLVYVEAMACAKPVIGPRLPGVRTVIDDGVTGLLVDPGNEDDIVQALDSLLADPAYRQRLGAAGLAKVQQRYTWPLVAERVEEVYRVIMPEL